MNVHFCTNSHEKGSTDRRAGIETYGKITVGQGSWIGADTIIMGGVNIGYGCIIGAGSLVANDCENNSLYFGRPVKKVRSL